MADNIACAAAGQCPAPRNLSSLPFAHWLFVNSVPIFSVTIADPCFLTVGGLVANLFKTMRSHRRLCCVNDRYR